MRLAGLTLISWLLAAAPAPAQVALADGERYVAWDVTPEQTTVRDDLRRTAVRVDRPAGCSSTVIGGGKLLWYCRENDVVLDLSTGVRTELPEDPEPEDGTVSILRIGRLWLERSFSSYRNDGLLSYVHLETGEVRSGPSGQPRPEDAAPGPRETIDLDEPDLATPLCAPLRRSEMDEFEATPTYYPYFFDGRLGVEVSYWLEIQRCGHKRARRLRADCQGPCEANTGGRRVVWERRYRDGRKAGLLAVYDDRTRRVRCLRVRRPLERFGHTRRRLWLTYGGSSGNVVRPVAFPRRRC